jgi:hypothetical protein
VIGCSHQAVQRPIRDEMVQATHVLFPYSHPLHASCHASRLRRPGRGHPLDASFPREPGRVGAWWEDWGRVREMAPSRRLDARS